MNGTAAPDHRISFECTRICSLLDAQRPRNRQFGDLLCHANVAPLAASLLPLEGRCRAKCNLLKRLIAVQDTALHPDPFIPSGWIVRISGTRRSCAEGAKKNLIVVRIFFFTFFSTGTIDLTGGRIVRYFRSQIGRFFSPLKLTLGCSGSAIFGPFRGGGDT